MKIKKHKRAFDWKTWRENTDSKRLKTNLWYSWRETHRVINIKCVIKYTNASFSLYIGNATGISFRLFSSEIFLNYWIKIDDWIKISWSIMIKFFIPSKSIDLNLISYSKLLRWFIFLSYLPTSFLLLVFCFPYSNVVLHVVYEDERTLNEIPL